MTAFKETQIIQCPNQKSFLDHISAFPDIQAIGLKHSCKLDWKILSKKDFTFELKMRLKSHLHQHRCIIDTMKYLEINNIDSADIIDSDYECQTRLEKIQNILKSA